MNMSKTSSMFLISVRFQRWRSRKQPDKLGIVYTEIARNCKDKYGDVSKLSKRMSTTQTKALEIYVDVNKNAIIELVRLAYCVIEHHTQKMEKLALMK